MITKIKKEAVARKTAPQSKYINIRVLRTTNQRIRLAAAKLSTDGHTVTVPEAIDIAFPDAK